MSITVAGRKMTVSDSLRQYAEEKIGNAMKVMDIDPLDAEVVLHVERNRSIANYCVCEVTLHARGHVIRVEEHETDMYAAIDVAAAKVVRQLRKFKTRVVERKTRGAEVASFKEFAAANSDFDPDALMAELEGDDEIVRVKEMEFEPMTQDDALLAIDLLGHDFFVYTDRDTNSVCVLYRRDGGGYGLLKQKEA